MSDKISIVNRLASLILLLLCLSCTEAPVQPEPVEPPSYKVYFHSEAHPERWITYNPETDHLDSLILPTPSGTRTRISPNGDRLYLYRMEGYGLLVIDLETRELITELTNAAFPTLLSPDGKLVGVVSDDYFGLASTTDWTVKYQYDLPFLGGITFSSDGNYLFGSTGSSYGWVAVADSQTINEELVVSGGRTLKGGYVLPSPDLDHWYIHSHPAYFVDWDREADTAVFEDFAFNNYPFYAPVITNSGKYVAYVRGSLLTSEFRIYDTELRQSVHSVSTNIHHDSGDSTLFAVTEMVITPDSKWLVGISFITESYLMVYNLEELRIERFVEIPGEDDYIGLACQTKE